MTTKQQSPYIPSFLKAAVVGNRPLQMSFSDVKESNILSTSSFIYDLSDSPLKSTQQLNVDWSKFENHTFFMSAEAKVNLAFDQIINGYPFDGSRAELESFFEKLSGFDKWVFDQFPKYKGQLMFSGTQLSETSPTLGTYVVVKDIPGFLYPELSKNVSNVSVLNPKNSSLSIEMHLYVPSQQNAGTQVVCQKMNGARQGFSFYLSPSVSTSTVDANFIVVSGSNYLNVSAPLDKGKFNHVCLVYNRENSLDFLQFYKSGVLSNESKNSYKLNNLSLDSTDLIIASGTKISLGATDITPTQTFSGSIDEFRLFHSVRSPELQKKYLAKSIYAQPDLKLYYRFNEPPPPLSSDSYDPVNSIVLDSSGNSLHANISNFFNYATKDITGKVIGSPLRQNAAFDNASLLKYEKNETIPVLFPGHIDTIDLNETLLSSASNYDISNPNLITRLIPQHYLLEGAAFDGFEEIEGEGNNPYSGNGIPGQGKLGNVQILLSLLYIWARYLDEIKLYIDAFSSLRTIDYDKNVSLPNNFIRDLFRQFGFYVPALFDDSTIQQYSLGENVDKQYSDSEVSIRQVQNELLRRILINLPEVIKSKGTQHSIRSFLRAVGIDPDNSIRLKEYGGPTSQQLGFSREFKREVGTMVKFTPTSLVISPYLSGSRVEPGYPPLGSGLASIVPGLQDYIGIPASFVQSNLYPPNGVSNKVDDGLLTSGSWTIETIVKYDLSDVAKINSPESLVRLCATGSIIGNQGNKVGLLANLVASTKDNTLTLYVRPGVYHNYGSGAGYKSPTLSLKMSLKDGAIFNGDKWNVAFGCDRNDNVNSLVSSSYFLMIANQNNGIIQSYQTTSSYFLECYHTSNTVNYNGYYSYSNLFRNVRYDYNASGSFIAIGQNQQIDTSSIYELLNNNHSSNVVPSEARSVNFCGYQSNLRFWSKALTKDEFLEHTRNYKSAGVKNPLINYNFTTTKTGSYEKLRLNCFNKQDIRRAGSDGMITFLDFSQNNKHMFGTGFPTTTDSLKGEIFDVSYLSPYYDEAATTEKIRVRSYQNQAYIDDTPWASTAPIYEIMQSELSTDDVRFTIDFSLIDSLNKDIVTMFATFDAIDNAIGSPELVYSPDYPTLEMLRNIYFNRLQEKLNFKSFFEFYRWFDMSIGTFIQQLIPKKTNFRGTNFLIESHMLERHKLEYYSSDIYLGESDRNRIKDVLLLQQIAGSLRKY